MECGFSAIVTERERVAGVIPSLSTDILRTQLLVLTSRKQTYHNTGLNLSNTGIVELFLHSDFLIGSITAGSINRGYRELHRGAIIITTSLAEHKMSFSCFDSSILVPLLLKLYAGSALLNNPPVLTHHSPSFCSP
jgi:hypothetical protein